MTLSLSFRNFSLYGIDPRFSLSNFAWDHRLSRTFRVGRGQAVRLPKEFRFAGNEVFIEKKGDAVILTPRPKSWSEFFADVPLPSEDFMDEARPSAI